MNCLEGVESLLRYAEELSIDSKANPCRYNVETIIIFVEKTKAIKTIDDLFDLMIFYAKKALEKAIKKENFIQERIFFDKLYFILKNTKYRTFSLKLQNAFYSSVNLEDFVSKLEQTLKKM